LKYEKKKFVFDGNLIIKVDNFLKKKECFRGYFSLRGIYGKCL